MNKQRRTELQRISKALDGLKSATDMAQMIETLERLQSITKNVANDEEMAADSMPENMQYSQRHDDMVDNVSDIEDAAAEMETAISELPNASGEPYPAISQYLESAKKSIQKAINR